MPVSPEELSEARAGKFTLLLTPTKPVPANWWPPLNGLRTLCLASGGGQQGPLLAAAGATVTVFDNSPAQLAQDRAVAERESLKLRTVEGDMADLSTFADASFDLIVHPCSNCFVPAVGPVWRECFRVLDRGGALLAGFVNPLRYLFDEDGSRLIVRHAIPYADCSSLSADEFSARILSQEEPAEFGHSLADLIGGQLEAGFVLHGFFEDKYAAQIGDPLSRHIDTFLATRAIKP